jgi:Anti-sigma-K factor rskA.
VDRLKNILSSDLLKRYLLGDVSSEERMEVDLLRIEHRAVREELSRIEIDLQSKCSTNNPMTDRGTKDCIIKNINGLEKTDSSIRVTGEKLGNSIYLRLGLSFMIGCLFIWLLMNHKMNILSDQLGQARQSISDIEEDYTELNNLYAFINHTSSRPILLSEKSKSSHNEVIVYWNEELQNAMLRVLELPGIRSDEDFQLWADVDGQMKSLGLFDASLAITDAIPIAYTDRASSLNISIESKGGSKQPTLLSILLTAEI